MQRPALMLSMTALLCLSALAQYKPPEPATIGLVDVLDPAANSIAPLERQTATQEFVVTPTTGVDPSSFGIYFNPASFHRECFTTWSASE